MPQERLIQHMEPEQENAAQEMAKAAARVLIQIKIEDVIQVVMNSSDEAFGTRHGDPKIVC